MSETSDHPKIHENPGHPLEVFWPPIRQARAHRSRLRTLGARKRRAALTIVHNEAVLFPIWLAYYSRFFAPEDIYVLDHDSTDGGTAGEGFVRITVTHDTFDNEWMVKTVEDQQHELLERYDVVLVTDVDEIVTPTPEWGGLDQYIDWFDEEYVNCVGYEIVQIRDREGPYDPSRQVLDQRGYWYAHDAYDKPALASVPMKWKPGFHKREDEASTGTPTFG